MVFGTTTTPGSRAAPRPSPARPRCCPTSSRRSRRPAAGPRAARPSRTMASAARSFTLPPGLSNSTFTQTSAGSPAVTRFSRISGVPPDGVEHAPEHVHHVDPAPTRSLLAVSTRPQDWSSWRARIDLDTLRRALAPDGRARASNPHGEADLICRLRAAFGARRRLRHRPAGHRAGPAGIAVLGVDGDPDMITRGPGEGPGAAVAGGGPGRAGPAGAVRRGRAGRERRAVRAGRGGPPRSAPAPGTSRPVAGWSPGSGCGRAGPPLADYDAWCAAAGLELDDRFGTWERGPYQGGDYAVSVHRAAG